ncbi:hypothetical protein K1719_030156 [Acacia pycnantha]|nr:hypothetical protein K1719_030156 [Acacia pycnantha]
MLWRCHPYFIRTGLSLIKHFLQIFLREGWQFFSTWSSAIIEDYPFAVDGLEIWFAIKTWRDTTKWMQNYWRPLTSLERS